MHMKLNSLVLSALTLSIPSIALAHFDVRPYVSAGQIITGGHDDAAGIDEPVVRVFGYDFGEDPADPFFAQDPGFNAEAGSGLPAGSQLRFNVLSSLLYWNGSGAVSLIAPPTESMTFSFGANNRTISGGSGPQSGFSLQTVGSDGSVHRHLNAFLNGSDGNAVPASVDGVEAPAGVYALALELASSDAAIASSAPFYLVFNNGLSEEQHDQAIDFIASSIVPEPGLVAVAGLAPLLRRRRR
jgi:hypothetical protein